MKSTTIIEAMVEDRIRDRLRICLFYVFLITNTHVIWFSCIHLLMYFQFYAKGPISHACVFTSSVAILISLVDIHALASHCVMKKQASCRPLSCTWFGILVYCTCIGRGMFRSLSKAQWFGISVSITSVSWSVSWWELVGDILAHKDVLRWTSSKEDG